MTACHWCRTCPLLSSMVARNHCDLQPKQLITIATLSSRAGLNLVTNSQPIAGAAWHMSSRYQFGVGVCMHCMCRCGVVKQTMALLVHCLLKPLQTVEPSLLLPSYSCHHCYCVRDMLLLQVSSRVVAVLHTGNIAACCVNRGRHSFPQRRSRVTSNAIWHVSGSDWHIRPCVHGYNMSYIPEHGFQSCESLQQFCPSQGQLAVSLILEGPLLGVASPPGPLGPHPAPGPDTGVAQGGLKLLRHLVLFFFCFCCVGIPLGEDPACDHVALRQTDTQTDRQARPLEKCHRQTASCIKSYSLDVGQKPCTARLLANMQGC